MNPDTLITGARAAELADVSRATICHWRDWGLLKPAGRRGRSPLYRLGDVWDVERDTRQSRRSPRNPARQAA